MEGKKKELNLWDKFFESLDRRLCEDNVKMYSLFNKYKQKFLVDYIGLYIGVFKMVDDYKS